MTVAFRGRGGSKRRVSAVSQQIWRCRSTAVSTRLPIPPRISVSRAPSARNSDRRSGRKRSPREARPCPCGNRIARGGQPACPPSNRSGSIASGAAWRLTGLPRRRFVQKNSLASAPQPPPAVGGLRGRKFIHSTPLKKSNLDLSTVHHQWNPGGFPRNFATPATENPESHPATLSLLSRRSGSDRLNGRNEATQRFPCIRPPRDVSSC